MAARLDDKAATWGTQLRALAVSHGEGIAIIDGDRRLSFLDLDRESDRWAAALSARGIGPGDRVAALLRDGAPFVAIFIAAAKLGAILVPLNWRLSAAEISYIVDHCRPSLWCVSTDFSALAEQAALGLDAIRVADQDRAAPDDVPPVAFADRASATDPLLILYTSGTTGRPKGCVLSHAAVMSVARSVRDWLGLTEDDRRFSASPLFHTGGLGLLLAYLLAGAGVVIMPRGATLDEIVELILGEGCTGASVPVTLNNEFLDEAERRPELRLRSFTGGGGLHAPEYIRRVGDTLGADMMLGYGQTEAAGYVGSLTAQEQLDRPQATVKLFPGTECRIVDQAGEPVANGGVGELCLRGPSVMDGYWEDAAATDATLRGGWLHTGDQFRHLGDGYLGFAGRSKELIKTGGENVYPREVENALRRHPAVRDCAVVGVPDPRWGESVKAYIVLDQPNGATAEEIVSECRRLIAHYKCPRRLSFVDRIPRTELGKVRAAELRAMAGQEHLT